MELYIQKFMKNNIDISIVKGSLNEFGESGYIIEKIAQSLDEKAKGKFIFHQLKIDNILNCMGCKRCFNKGICSLDNTDNFFEVKDSLKISEIIIISTPIYVNNVSGSLKTFIDRLALWTHLMLLAGKLCILVITTQNSGIKNVNEYLYKVISSLGIIIVGIIIKQKGDDLNYVNDQIETSVFNALYYLKKPYIISTNQMLEKYFQSYNYIYNNCFIKNSKNYEMIQWMNRYKNINTFQDYIDKYNNS